MILNVPSHQRVRSTVGMTLVQTLNVFRLQGVILGISPKNDGVFYQIKNIMKVKRDTKDAAGSMFEYDLTLDEVPMTTSL